MYNRKLILTGFMGTGKTTLGRHVAERMGLPFVDMDDKIIERAGMSIPEIFAKQGEIGFRAWESAICAELAESTDLMVIATGGGTMLNPVNRAAFAHETVICLTAPAEVVYHRVKNDTNRPLLADAPNLKTHIQELQWQRKPAYDAIRWQVANQGLPLEDLGQELLNIWAQDCQGRNAEIRVETPEGSYPIVLGEGMLNQLPQLLEVYGLAGRRTIIGTDTNIANLHGQKLLGMLPNASLVVMQAGESAKHMETVTKLYDALANHKLDRNGLVIALGGGVVGDTLGMVAATYMRGVCFVQIPTSLLAMVDSSVGGKVGVDIPLGKNLVGAFKQPDLVVIDPQVLETLPEEEYRAGMAEVIKCGFIANPNLLRADLPLMDKIRGSVEVKIDIVQRDPYERGERAFLNLGHTFAHAIEHVSGYSWRHGDAVGVGLVGAARLSQRLELLKANDVQLVEQTVQAIGLPTRYRYFNAEAIWDAMTLDKKWVGGRSHFVMLQGIGKPVLVQDVPREFVLEVLESLRE